MAIGYRAILRLSHGHNAITVAEDQLRSWLREKKAKSRSGIRASDWDGPGVHKLGEHAELHVVHGSEPADPNVRRLYRLREKNASGDWVVSLYASALSGGRENAHTIVVEVDLVGADRASALSRVDPPRIVRSILDTVGASDGSTVLTGDPVIIRAGQASEVVHAIQDPDRTASVIVAESFEREVDEDWRTAVTSLTKQSVGVAATYVVYADAVPEINASLPESHQIGPGRVRTFLPRVDRDDPADSNRHKWLGPATFQRSITKGRVAVPLTQRHAEVARRRFVENELPADIRRTIDLLRRSETAMERGARVAERVADTEPDRQSRVRAFEAAIEVLDRQIAASETEELVSKAQVASRWYERARVAVQRWLGIPEPALEDFDQLESFIVAKLAEVDVAEEQLSDAAHREEHLQSELGGLRSQLEDWELELAIAEDEHLSLQHEVTELRKRIAASPNPDTYIPPIEEEWKVPETIEELVSRITPGAEQHTALTYVQFTGDLAKALEIDQRYPSGLYSKSIWQYVRVLHDYAAACKAGDFNGSVHMYLTDDRVDGTKCSPTRHAAKESDSVLNNEVWRRERELPVPKAVNRAGLELMESHFKPTHTDRFAPRVHYLNDIARTGKIYIGYIGKHLTNKQS